MRPFGLLCDSGDAGPAIGFLARGHAVANRFAAGLDKIEILVLRIDDYRARRLAGRIVDAIALELNVALYLRHKCQILRVFLRHRWIRTFAPHDEGGTLVTLEHRNLERFGADAAGHAEKLRGGWPTHLREFADYANANM